MQSKIQDGQTKRQNDKEFVSAVVRRIIFAGLVIIGAWLVLFALRGAIPDSLISQMNEIRDRQPGNTPLSGIPSFSNDSSTWDWTRSLWTGDPISSDLGPRLVLTIATIVLSGALSLVIACLMLLVGFFAGRATERPVWLAKLRSILRLVIISRGASIPFFTAFTLIILFPWRGPMAGQQGLLASTFITAFISAIMPAWLLVQAGHGEMANRRNMPGLAGHTAVFLVIRLLRLTGLILAIHIVSTSGLGIILEAAVNQRDFPVAFYVVWIFAVIVILAKLAADLIELAYKRFGKAQQPVEEQAPLQFAIPKGWLIFCLALAGLSILVAVFGPMLAPYGWNEIMLQNRLAPPGPGLLLGADNVGRDILSRILHGIRTDLYMGMAVAVIVVLLATGWSMLAERLKRTGNQNLEELVMLPLEILRAFPWLALLLLLLSMGWWGQGIDGRVDMVARISSVVLISSLVLLPRIVVLIREAVSSRENGRLKSLLLAVPVAFIFTVAAGILYIAAVSYYGMGVPPPYPELAGMLSGAGRQFMMTAPWMMLWPSLILSLLLFAWVMAGDALLERMGIRSKTVWAKTME